MREGDAEAGSEDEAGGRNLGAGEAEREEAHECALDVLPVVWTLTIVHAPYAAPNLYFIIDEQDDMYGVVLRK